MRIRTEVPTGPLSVSHRKRLIEELRSDPKLAAEYLRAAAEDADSRVFLAALTTVSRALWQTEAAMAYAHYLWENRLPSDFLKIVCNLEEWTRGSGAAAICLCADAWAGGGTHRRLAQGPQPLATSGT
jgi:hypothetical protein